MSVVCSCKGFHHHVHCSCSQPLQDSPFLKRKVVFVHWKTCKHQCSSIDGRSALTAWIPEVFIFCERHLHFTLNFRPLTYYRTLSAELQEKHGQVLKFTARLPGHLSNSGISVHLDLEDHFLKTSSSLTWQHSLCTRYPDSRGAPKASHDHSLFWKNYLLL